MEDTLGARVRRIRLELITPEDMREEDRSKRSVQMSENIKLLGDNCPNLRVVELDARNADSHGLDVGISALHSLQLLILYSFVISRPLMYSLSSPNPQLTTLILSSIFCRIPHHVEFLHLTRIHIDIRSISGRLASICAPQTPMDQSQHAMGRSGHPFFTAECKNATFLRLGQGDVMSAVIEAAYACPRPETLGVGYPRGQGGTVSQCQPHQSLRTLVLYCADQTTVVPALAQWGFERHIGPSNLRFTSVVV